MHFAAPTLSQLQRRKAVLQRYKTNVAAEKLSLNFAELCKTCKNFTAKLTCGINAWNLLFCNCKHLLLQKQEALLSLQTLVCYYKTALQWGTVNAEIKRPTGWVSRAQRSSLLNPEQVCTAMHAQLTGRDFFLVNFYTSSPFTCIFSKTSPKLYCVGCG